MAEWNGRDWRTADRCCDGDMKARVRALEVYRETHQETLASLSRSLETTNSRLEATNCNLSKVVNKLTEIKTTQRNTHAFAGFFGTVLGGIGEYLFHGFKN